MPRKLGKQRKRRRWWTTFWRRGPVDPFVGLLKPVGKFFEHLQRTEKWGKERKMGKIEKGLFQPGPPNETLYQKFTSSKAELINDMRESGLLPNIDPVMECFRELDQEADRREAERREAECHEGARRDDKRPQVFE
jgi:hypothetical protein